MQFKQCHLIHKGCTATLIFISTHHLHSCVCVYVCATENAHTHTPKFLLCEHNRDGDSHRSPWSNAYFPPLDDGFRPSERLRSLELHANEVFDIYRELYYGKSTSVGSAYLWDNNEGSSGGSANKKEEISSLGFSGCFLIQNRVDEGNSWNSIHVVDVGRVSKGKCTYKLTTTLLLSVTPPHTQSSSSSSTTNISGSLVRHNVRECKVSADDDSSHIINIGKFIEDVELEMRSEMDSLYVQKTRTVLEEMRKDGLVGPTQGQEHTKVLNEAVLAMAMERKAKLG
mmetsp:Transcript_18029/g.32619  ORF Transcript_18029/g.32619 Transcript_18029/m.32619 type:complete len:284 (+) Transcript_18029:49-900(+)